MGAFELSVGHCRENSGANPAAEIVRCIFVAEGEVEIHLKGERIRLGAGRVFAKSRRRVAHDARDNDSCHVKKK
jgi:hypothetical protein